MADTNSSLTALGNLIDRMIVDIREAGDAAFAHDVQQICSEDRTKVLVHQWHVRGCNEPDDDVELIEYLDQHMSYTHEMARFNMGMITAEAARYNCVPYAFCVLGDRDFSYILEGTEASIALFLRRWYYVPDEKSRPNSGVTRYEAKPIGDIRRKRRGRK